jgi:hypothetical protein
MFQDNCQFWVSRNSVPLHRHRSVAEPGERNQLDRKDLSCRSTRQALSFIQRLPYEYHLNFQETRNREAEMKRLILLVMGLMLLAGCATGKAVKPSGDVFLGEYYNKLAPGGKDEAKLIWIKPGVDFSKYKKVMVDYVIFAFADDSEYKGIDADELKKIADEASLALATALQKEFPVVSQAGPDVLRVRTAITDLKQSYPGLSGVTSVVPVGLAISLVKKGATDAWTGSGATTAELMALDSMTNEVLAAGLDEKSAGFTERFSKWGSLKDAFDFWGERLAKRLVELTKKK